MLMGEHFHLLPETPQPNPVAGMKGLPGVFSDRLPDPVPAVAAAPAAPAVAAAPAVRHPVRGAVRGVRLTFPPK